MHNRVRLRLVPNAADTVSVIYKKAVSRLVNDQDIPEIPCHNALIAGAYADALKEQKQTAKAQIEEQRYEALIDDMIRKVGIEGANVEFSQPYIDSQRGL